MKREHQESIGGGSGLAPLPMKSKMTEEEEGVDELLAALGYKVRSSEMADVAQKLEQLDMVMGSSSSAAQDDAVLSHLAADAVHYNPSDLSSWLESMLSELNAPPPPLPLQPQPQPQPRPNPFDFSPSAASSIFDPAESSTITTSDLYEGRESGRDRKRMKTTTTTTTTASPRPSSAEVSSLPLVVVDSQEAGIRLVHALMACAEAVQLENLKVADALIRQITVLAASQLGTMRKVAGYFAEALARRIYGIPPPNDPLAFADILHMNFYESAPYLKFAHFTANQAILEAFSGRRRVHVIDLGMKQGTQWPALLQALALRPGGPPSFRLTAVSADGSDALQQVGLKLAQLAETIHVDFDFRGVVADSVADLDLNLLLDRSGGEDDEAVAVNAVFELHRLLARPGAVERAMSAVRAARPAIVTVVEQEASHNGTRFAERFNEALHYYSTMFDSLEASAAALASPSAATTGDEGLMSEVYLGRQICNLVACEGEERTERHETVSQWRARFGRAGFEPVHLGSNAFKQASMLLALFAGGDGYRVEEREGCLTLGWHTRPLIATSAWRVAD